MFRIRLRSALHQGWTFFTLYVIGYVVTQLSVLLFWHVFHMRNKLAVSGPRARIGKYDLVVANHVTLIDHFLIIVILSWPRLLWRCRSALIGFIADRENFFGNWFLRYYMRLARIIPIDRKREVRMKNGPSDALDTTLATLRQGPVGIYPQGTRVLPGWPESLDLGVGMIVARALSKKMPIRVIPVWLEPLAMAALQPHVKTWEQKQEPTTRGWKLLRRLFGKRAYWILDHTTGNELRLIRGQPVTTEELQKIAESQRTKNRRAVALTRYIWGRVEALSNRQLEEAS